MNISSTIRSADGPPLLRREARECWLYDEGQKKANVMKADARGLSSVSLAADSSLCGGSLWGKRVCGRGISPLRRRGGGFPIAPATPSAPTYKLMSSPRRKVAAALSAAVTTTPKQKNAPT